MVDKTNLLEKSVKTLRQRGVVELSRKAAVYLARAVAGRSNKLSNSLDFAILRDSLMREYGSVLQRNEIFRDLHAGRRCFVIGNGPSLKEQDLKRWPIADRSEEHTSELQSHSDLVCRLLLEKKKNKKISTI